MSDTARERAKFLKELKEFDDNLMENEFLYDEMKELLDKQRKEKNSTQSDKSLLLESGNDGAFVSKIDYKLIVKLTMNKELKIFNEFYNLDNKKLKTFFKTLHKTQIALEDFEERICYEPREKKRRESLVKKYDAVIEDIENHSSSHYMSNCVTLIKINRDRLKEIVSLLTERQIFENLLHSIHILIGNRKTNPNYPTRKIATITNNIISEYFGKDISFSEKTKITSFSCWKYSFKKDSFNLYHS